jgi:hypothetical protein
MNDVGQLIRDANPIQGDPALLADDEFEALLLLAQTRSANVDVQDLTKPVESEKKQRNGWLVATVAFAVVILFVGAAMLLASPADEQPAATTPPTTTEAVSVIQPGPITSFEDIAGTIYRSQGGGLQQYLYFVEDGTMHGSTNPDLVVDRASDVYTTRFDGTQVFITMAGSRCAQPDQGGTYEIHLLENGNLQFVAIDEDPCALRSGFLQQGLDRDGVPGGGFVPVPGG